MNKIAVVFILLFVNYVFGQKEELSIIKKFINYDKERIQLSLDYMKKQLGHGKMILSVSNITNQELYANLRSLPMGIDLSLKPEGVLLDFKEPDAKRELLNKLAGSSFDIEEFKLYKPTLEEIFKEQVGK